MTAAFVWFLLTAKRPAVIVSSDGVFDRRLSSGPIPWSAIVDVTNLEHEMQRRIVLVLRAGSWARYGKPKWFWPFPPPRWGLSERSDILTWPLRVNFSELFETIRSRAKAATQSFVMGEEIVGFYQQLGFFEGRTPRQIVERFDADMRRPPDTNAPWDDLWLLRYDSAHVWADDPEADVGMGSKIYVRLLEEWSNISQGAFSPTNVTELWNGVEGPISVHFHLKGVPATIHPSFLNDWIDLDILQRLNEMIVLSGRSFEYICTENIAVVLFLTPEQKNAMRDQRNLPFAF